MKLKAFWRIFGFFGLLFLVLVSFWAIMSGMENFSANSTSLEETRVVFSLNGSKSVVKAGEQRFFVVLAKTAAQTSRGLMFVEQMPADFGMLFLFSREGFWEFYMKNTKIPLDIVWINENLEIVDVQTLFPCETANCPTFAPKNPAKYVLEVNAGQFQAKIGEKVEFLNVFE